MKTKKMNVETSANKLVLTRVFDAPREKVFEAFSDCVHLNEWWGPRTWPLSYCKMDFREGGSWHYCMKGPNPEDMSWGKAVYQEIRKPEFLSYEDHFSDQEGKVNKAMPSSLSSNSFTENDGKTTLTCSVTYASEEDLEKVLELGMVDGISETFDRLDEHLDRISK